MSKDKWMHYAESVPGLAELTKPKMTKYIPEYPHPKQAAFLLVPHLEALFGGSSSPGKSLAHSSAVCTPLGFVKMADIHVGSKVSNPDGSVANVIAVYEQGEQDIFDVVFSDGSKARATEDHLWVAWLSNRRPQRSKDCVCDGDYNIGNSDVFTTKNLIDHIENKDKRNRRSYAIVPATMPVTFSDHKSKEKMVVDPYLLGLLLGDGCMRGERITITSGDMEIVNYIKSTGINIVKNEKHRYVINECRDIREKLKEIGVYGKIANEKFVPDCYKTASVEDRLELLRGLMDTDGTADKDGGCSYCSVSKQLAKDVQYLVRSIGGNAIVRTENPWYYKVNETTGEKERKYCQIAYKVTIGTRNNADLFNLERKKARCSPKKSVMGKRIVSITKSGREQAKCIKVDHPNGLFITDDFIVTHNTSAILMGALQYVDCPNYAALLLRKTFADLNIPGAILDRAKKWLMPWQNEVHWSDKNKTFTFPSGAKITFGYLDHHDDKYRYQGSEFQYVGFDELTQFEEDSYLYLFSRLRKAEGVNIPIRMRAATNPGGIGGRWVKERFVNKHNSPDRIFVKAKIDDNPSVDKITYIKALNQLSDVERKQLLDGDWDVQKSGLVYPTMSQPHPKGAMCNTFGRTKGPTFGGIDWGFTGPSCFLCGTLDDDDVLWVWFERYIRGCTLQENMKEIPTEGDITWFADPAQPELIQQMRNQDFVIRKAINRHEPGVNAVTQRLRNGKLRISASCKALLEEADLYRYKDDRDIEPDSVGDSSVVSESPIKRNDHAMDALRYMCIGIEKYYGRDVLSPTEVADRVSGTVEAAAKLKPFTLARTPEDPVVSKEEMRDWLRIDNDFFWS